MCDLQAAAGVLRSQLRFAHNLAEYLVVKHGQEGSLSDIPESLRRLDARIEEKVERQVHECARILKEWEQGPKATYTRLLVAMSEAQGEMKRILEAAAPTLRTARQAMYGKGPEYPQPSLFFGMDQQAIHDRASAVAKQYATRTSELVRKLLGREKLDGRVTVAFEYIPSPVQRNVHHSPDGAGPDIDVFVSAPIWHLVMPKYLPVLCHEIAHPFVQVMFQDSKLSKFDAHLVKFCDDAYDVIANHLGSAVPFSLNDQVGTMAREVLTDLVALMVAGPAYGVSWLAATFGHTPLTATHRPSLPTFVRLKVLLAVLGEFKRIQQWLPLLLEQDCKLYEEAARSTGLAHKLAYQSALQDVCVQFAKTAWTHYELGKHLPDGGPPEVWRDEVRVGCGLANHATVPDPELLWWGGSAVSAPALLWDVHLGSRPELQPVPAPGVEPRFPAEGRVFHHIAGELVSSGLEQGRYWEWLGIKRYYGAKDIASDDAFIQTCKGKGEPDELFVVPSLGPYNIVSMRSDFVAKRFYQYPPATEPGGPRRPHHASRQILVELFRQGNEADRSRKDHLQGSWPMAMVSEISLCDRMPATLKEAVGSLYSRSEALLAFGSLAASDLVVFTPVATLEQLEDARRWIADVRGIKRSMSHLLLNPLLLKKATGTVEGPERFALRSFLRLAGTLSKARDEVESRLRSWPMVQSFERVWGPDDLEIEWKLQSEMDLPVILERLRELLQTGMVGNVDSRFSYVGRGGEA